MRVWHCVDRTCSTELAHVAILSSHACSLRSLSLLIMSSRKPVFSCCWHVFSMHHWPSHVSMEAPRHEATTGPIIDQASGSLGQ